MVSSQSINNAFYFTKYGSGACCVFLPGMGWSGMEGLNIAQSLASERTTYLLDLPGAGRSERIGGRVTWQSIGQWLNTFANEVSPDEPVDVIGHSIGGLIGLAFANTYPHKVRRLVLLDTAYRNWPRFLPEVPAPVRYLVPILSLAVRIWGENAYAVFGSGDDTAKEVRQEDFDTAVAHTTARFGIPDSPHLRAALKDPVTTPGNAMAGLVMAIYQTHHERELRRVSVPTMVVYGQRSGADALKIHRQIERLSRSRAPLTLVSAQGAHYVHWSDSHHVLSVVKTFLTQDDL